MFKVTKRMEISAAHSLNLPYESKCSNLHGHNWIIDVEVSAEDINKHGMVIDFVHIKETVMVLDHANLNALLDFNPTAENIAEWIADRIDNKIYDASTTSGRHDGSLAKVTKVTVQESEGNTACYIP